MLKTLSIGSICAIGFFAHNNRKISKAENLDSKLTTSRNAICILYPFGDVKTYGLVSFSQESILSKPILVANVMGLRANSAHTLEFYEFGDLSDNCKSLGEIYKLNKSKKKYSSDDINIKTDENGKAYLVSNELNFTLFGDDSIIGRSCVVNDDESLPTAKQEFLACGIVGLSADFKTLTP